MTKKAKTKKVTKASSKKQVSVEIPKIVAHSSANNKVALAHISALPESSFLAPKSGKAKHCKTIIDLLFNSKKDIHFDENEFIDFIAKKCKKSRERIIATSLPNNKVWAESTIHSALNQLSCLARGANNRTNSQGVKGTSFGKMRFCIDKSDTRVTVGKGYYLKSPSYSPATPTTQEVSDAIEFYS